MATRKSKSRKRANGDGSIFELPDGTWRAIVSCGSVGGRRIRRTRNAATREQARQKLRELQDEIRGALPEKTEITVAEWLETWLSACREGGLAEATIASYTFAVTNHIVPHIGAAKLASLTGAHIDNMVRRIKSGARTKETAFETLRTALGRACKKGLIPENPANAADPPASTRKRIEVFTAAEAKAILTATTTHRLRGVFLLGMTLGLRQGEIFGLRWSDIDFEAGTIKITQQACEVAGKMHFRKPKTDAGQRTIRISETIQAVLHERRTAALREGHVGADLVFVTENGTPMFRSNFGHRHWRPLLKKLKLRHRGFHTARHTAASLMLGAGISVHVVAQILGHSKPSVTFDVYSHLMPHQAEAATEIVEKLLG